MLTFKPNIADVEQHIRNAQINIARPSAANFRLAATRLEKAAQILRGAAASIQQEDTAPSA
jgi:hypothetical protein